MNFAQPHLLFHARLIAVALVVTVTGCASTSPTACDSSSLQQRGYAHAMQGSDSVQPTKSSCSKKSAPLAYSQGFDYGLEKYCTFKRGLWAGEMGKEVAENCSGTKWDEYHNGYLTGHEIFDINSKLEAIGKQLDAARSQLWDLEAKGEAHASPPVQAKIAQIKELKQLREQVSQTLMNLKADTRLP